jgi:ATP-dependent Lon protease
VVLPRENEPDLEDLPKEARDSLEFVLADTIDQVLATALEQQRVTGSRPTLATAEPQAAMPA